MYSEVMYILCRVLVLMPFCHQNVDTLSVIITAIKEKKCGSQSSQDNFSIKKLNQNNQGRGRKNKPADREAMQKGFIPRGADSPGTGSQHAA